MQLLNISVVEMSSGRRVNSIGGLQRDRLRSVCSMRSCVHAISIAVGVAAGLPAFAQTTVQAWASANLLGSGTYDIEHGPNAAASSTFDSDKAHASSSSSAAGFMSSAGRSDAAGLSNGVGGLASVKYGASLRGPSGAHLPTTIGFSVSFTTDVFTEFVASSIPQSIGGWSVDFSLDAGPSNVKGHWLETWQNGILLIRQQSGGWVGSATYGIEPSISVGARVLNLTPGDLQFLQVNLNLANLSQQQLSTIDFSSLAASISHSIFNLGLPAYGIAPGVTVGVGFGVRGVSNSAASATVQMSSGGTFIDALAQNDSKSGPSASAASSIQLGLSGFSVADADLGGVLADPRFTVLPDGRLGYYDQSGVLRPVAILVDSGQREFYVYTGGHGGCEAPAILAADGAASTCPGGSATLSVTAHGSGPFAYQWRKGTAIIDPLINPSAATAQLVLPVVGPGETGSYSCLVTSPCGSVASNAAAVRVCHADLNCDHAVDLDDFFEFFNCFDQSQACADLDSSGDVDLNDFFTFLNAFDVGC